MSLAENIPELLKNMLLVRGLLNLSWPGVKRPLPAARLDPALLRGLLDCSLAARKAREAAH